MKKILQVRFVNFGKLGVAVNLLFSEQAAPNFLREYDHNPYLSKNLLNHYRVKADQWVETLNSGDAPLPRLVAFDDEFILYHSDTKICRFGKDELEALNKIYDKEAEIHTPKKYEANRKRLYPREFEASEVNIRGFESQDFIESAKTALKSINQLQQTESVGLEVHELTVYEV